MSIKQILGDEHPEEPATVMRKSGRDANAQNFGPRIKRIRILGFW